jgi:GT2 family glycosyltransferase
LTLVQPEVSVVIINLNGRHFLDRCLDTVLAQTHPDFEIVLVDNGSADGSADFVRDRFPAVHLIDLPRNVGFCEANNVGIRATRSRFVATLNNDTWVDPDWLIELARPMLEDDQIGTCASKMLFAHAPDVINSAGIALDPVGIAWDRLGGAPASADATVPVAVFGGCAGAALYRRTMLDDVGAFDPAYFIYMEDVDLAWRAQLRGWRAVYVPHARVYHIHSATSRDASPFKSYHLARNKIWTIVKNYPSPQFWYYLPLIALYDAAAVVYALLARRDLAALRGRLAALRDLSDIVRKRQAVQARRRAPFDFLQAAMHPLENPLAVRRRYDHLATRRDHAGIDS